MTAPTSPPDARERSGPPAPRRLAGTSRWLLVVVVLVVAAAAAAVHVATREDRIFPEGRAWSEPIGDDPRLDAASGDIAALLGDPDRPPTMNLNEFGNPVYTADGSTPRYDVQVLRSGTEQGKWGDNVLAHTKVPIPDAVQASSGSDGKIVVIDPETDQVFDLWRARRVGSGWQVEWGGIYPLDGDGSSHRASYGDGRYQVPWPLPLSRGTGAGTSSLAGVIRAAELEKGHIPHALAFSTDKPCGPAQTGPHRWPATTTDGFVTDGPCIPQGARVRLDPSIDLDAVPGLTEVERTIGRALQEYGAYCIDGGGSRMAFATEAARTPEHRATYRRLGLSDDYHALAELPAAFSVLARWDGR